MDFRTFFVSHNIPLPPRLITSNSNVRWGKNNRYSAHRIEDNGIFFYDFKTQTKIIEFFESQEPFKSYTPFQKQQYKKAKLKSLKQKQEKQAKAAQTARQLYKKFSTTGNSFYLNQKQVYGIGVRYTNTCTAIPIYSIEGEFVNIQFIYTDGTKRFFKGARKSGCFHVIGKLENQPYAYCTEGYATAMSVHMATGLPVIIAFDAGNIASVIKTIKDKFNNLQITIAGDNDLWGSQNIGKDAALKASRLYGCSTIFPKFMKCMHKYKPTDFNDLHILQGLPEVRKQLEMGGTND